MSSNFSVSPTEIPGLLLIDVPVYGDNRGWFKENWQNAKLAAAGLPVLGPVQNNISFNAAVGVTRGIHAEPWDKYISVANGKVLWSLGRSSSWQWIRSRGNRRDWSRPSSFRS